LHVRLRSRQIHLLSKAQQDLRAALFAGWGIVVREGSYGVQLLVRHHLDKPLTLYEP
jgi:hypothetical protein